MEIITQERATAAAQKLIRQLGLSPMHHSIWVTVGLAKGKSGKDEFTYKVMCSKHPSFKGAYNCPDEMDGVAVEQVKWPNELI